MGVGAVATRFVELVVDFDRLDRADELREDAARDEGRRDELRAVAMATRYACTPTLDRIEHECWRIPRVIAVRP